MSFSGTPLGQGRRLDHYTFLNKPKPKSQQKDPSSPPKSNHLIPTSYAYGAPSSPPKVPKTVSRESHLGNEDDDPSEPALVRFARLKQREQTSTGPGVITNPPNPEKWTVRDTTVNVATAFHQAATSDMPPVAHDPNASWASGRTKTSLPRSTSVEYEKETQSTTSRRLAAPPSRLAPPRPTQPPRRPISKQQSIRHVPDSEGEGEEVNENGRAKSPFEQAVDFTKRALAPATFYLRQRSQEPQNTSTEQQNMNGTNGDSSHSYDYSAEEHEFQTQVNGNGSQKPLSSASARRPHATHRKNRMSTDNKAYRPSNSDLEVSDDDVSDDGKRRRRKKKKKEPVGGPLTTLPVTSYDKRRKKRGGKSGGEEDGEEDDSDYSGSEELVGEQRRTTTPSVRPPLSRGSAAPPSRASARGGSIPPPMEPYDSGFVDTSMDIEQGLDSIPEQDEYPPEVDDTHYSDTPVRSGFSVGALLGKVVYFITRGIRGTLLFCLRLVALFAMLVGRIIGTVIDVVFRQPLRLLSYANSAALMKLAAYVLVGACVYALWYQLRDASSWSWFPTSRPRTPFHAPGMPAADLAELSTRLQAIENALSGMSLDHERALLKSDIESRAQTELIGRVGDLETRIQKESTRMLEAENQFRSTASKGLQAVRDEVAVLQAQIQESARVAAPEGPYTDEEARAKLQELEERVGGVEGGVKEALESAKSSVKLQGPSGAGWWNKLASGTGSGTSLVIKSTDGQDVTSLIGDMVDSAVSRYSKDVLARPDLALHSAGASIVPSLTSDTFELKPGNVAGKVYGWFTGHGYAIGRPPVTALHHELHAGHCWPFAGSHGQLGVLLSHPSYISDVTIDHVAKEVAFDMRSAPRDMELWGLIDGRDNIAKIRGWQLEKRRRTEEMRVEAESAGLPPSEDDILEYPSTLEKDRFIRIANFSYDINAPNNIQTFAVSQEIRELGVDFGMVVLVVKSNWGMDDYTCLYRLRVHGERIGDPSLTESEDTA